MSKQTATQRQTHKAAKWKKDIVANIERLGKEYPIIGLLNMENLPASSLLRMKKQLRGKVQLVMTRKTLIKRGLEKLKLPNGEELIAKIKGMPALMFTKDNPFALYKTIKKSKSKAPAKPGQQAPFDIIIPAGPTPFGPGPIISEFAQLGIKAAIEGGKVVIKKEAVAVKEGETISGQLASMLQKLGIEPMEIGLDLVCAYEKGIIYDRKVLDINEEEFLANLAKAASGARNLAVEISYATKDTIETLLGKASRQARALGIEAGITSPDLIQDVLAKAQREAQALANQTQN
ncbi:50S ribosomal protein L10 [Candidatus Woesearchaeota archaeon]|nr:MAG: 50S ribosomal protein L10 [Candidatus Woesearchaeota archaeon]